MIISLNPLHSYVVIAISSGTKDLLKNNPETIPTELTVPTELSHEETLHHYTMQV